MVWGLETLLREKECSFISRNLLDELVPAGDAAAVSQHLPEGARGAEERGKEQHWGRTLISQDRRSHDARGIEMRTEAPGRRRLRDVGIVGLW